MQLLIRYFNEINKQFYSTALCYAIQVENIKIVKLLLANKKIDVNIPFILILHL